MKCCLILQPQNPACYKRLVELITAIPDLLQAQDQAYNLGSLFCYLVLSPAENYNPCLRYFAKLNSY